MNGFARIALLFVAAACVGGFAYFSAARGLNSNLENGSVNIFGVRSGHSAQPEKRDPSVARFSESGYDITPLSEAKIAELAKSLTSEEAKVLLGKGTEPAFCGTLTDNKKDGVYLCRVCSLPLFKSDAKFHSGTGWPSFFQPVDRAHIDEISDTAYGMVRTEILCARCHSHQGHVFDDGPRPTGLRYCVNSVSLSFVENGQPLPAAAMPLKTETAYFAGGCFWGVEDRFQQLPGVIAAVSGYMGGKVANPQYKQVCSEETGHAEAVRVVFDPAKISYQALLEKFFKFHNPTTLNRQGPDEGTQYRSAIFAADDAQLSTAKKYVETLQSGEKYKGRKIVTQVLAAAKAGEPGQFWAAEEYHQDYHVKNGGHCAMPEE